MGKLLPGVGVVRWHEDRLCERPMRLAVALEVEEAHARLGRQVVGDVAFGDREAVTGRRPLLARANELGDGEIPVSTRLTRLPSAR